MKGDKKKENNFILRRIYLLIWKNILFRRRHWIITSIEILLPTLIAMFMAFTRTQLDEGSYKKVERNSIFPPSSEQELLEYSIINILCNDCVLGYTPINPLTDEIMRQFREKIPESQSEFSLKGFENEEELEKYAAQADLKSAFDDPKLKAAIVFDALTDEIIALNGSSFPKNYKFSYRVRPASYSIYTNNLFEWFQFPGPELENAAKYTLGGFSAVQIILDRIIIQLLTEVEPTQEINTQVFPYPPYVEVKDFSQFYFFLLPNLLVLGFIFIVPSNIRSIVSERESGIKELMKLMGLPNWMHWLGWMINSLLILTFSVTIVVFLFFYNFSPKTGPVIAYGNPTVWWFVLFLFLAAATAFCFFISTFSQRPTLATTIGVVLWIATYYGVSIPLEARYRTLTLYEKLASAIVPSMGLHLVIKVMCGFEGQAVGSQWSNFFEPVSDVDGLSVAHICGVFLLDIVIYSLLTLYLEAILPSKYGIRKPWYFLLKPSTYVTPVRKVATRRRSILAMTDPGRPGFEAEPSSLNAGVVIHKLTKKFGKKKTAVNDISIKMYEGQITALLGHNGAGKTTTMSMLTGLFPPTSGSAYLNGYDIKHQMDKARRSLGLCPQHNMLFDQLTVKEHLLFFGRIKGLSANDAEKEARVLINKLQMRDSKNKKSCNLSGGQKRKLSLGMALIGGTKVVILDEPTSGMDPEARRVIWDLLLEMRGQRTIVLTTHFMEEADILGDRVAIMTNGKIECYGSPMFLKKYYGTGYTLKMTTTPDATSPEILRRIHKYLPKSYLKTEHAPNSSELSVAIPSEENTTGEFPAMFEELSNNKDELGIKNIGLSLTTMDEVFVKIGESEPDHDTNDNSVMNKMERTTTFTNGHGHKNGANRPARDDRLRGFKLFKQQWMGLLRKKIIYSFRNRKLLFFQFLVSPLLVIAAIYLSYSSTAPSTNSPPLTMSLSSYSKKIKTLFLAENDTVSEAYKNAVGSSAMRVQSDIINELVRLGSEDLGVFRQEYIVGAEINDTIITALFSSIPYHAAPLSVNLISNAILQAYAPEENYSISLTIHPLQNDLFNILEAAQPNPALSFIVPIIFGAFVPMGLALFAAAFIIFPIEERTSKAKQLQLMTGVSTLSFWGTSFLWDFFMMVAAIGVIIACFPIFQSFDTYTAHGGLYVLLLIFIVWGFSSISYAYFFSFLSSNAAYGFAFKTGLHIITGIFLPFGLFLVNSSQKDTDTSIISIIGRIFPSFSASVSIMRFASLATQNSRCNVLKEEDKALFCNPDVEVDPQLLQCCNNCAEFANPFGPSCFTPEPYLTWSWATDGETKQELPGIAQEVFWMLIAGLAYQLLLVLIEYGSIRRLIWNLFCRTRVKKFVNSATDEDTMNEKVRVKDLLETGRANEDGFIVANLCKNYGGFAAVSNLNFGVHHGECFGLLGVNGAGKTTTFKMITGDEIPSNGNAYGFMHTLQNHRKKLLADIGYCPQFDAIIGVLTGREMLELFCNLRGVPKREQENEINKWLQKLGLTKAGDVKCMQYSGGMKRRLSVGMAMIGDPPIVLLDEPTSGVDPVARRQFWSVISDLKGTGQCVILTSHSMEECEALCSRLGIMVNGQLQCLGGVQHLKNKFAKGFSLVLRLKDHMHSTTKEAMALKEEISRLLQPCELKDEHQNVLQYQILNTEMPWNLIFKIVEDCKSRHIDIIEDYSVSETTLEEVFLSFARKQYSARFLS